MSVGQLEGGGGQCPPFSSLKLGDSVGRRKEKQNGEVGSSEAKWREVEGKQFPVADRCQFIIVDFGLKPSFQPSRQAEVNLSDVIFIRTHCMRRPEQSLWDPSAYDWL